MAGKKNNNRNTQVKKSRTGTLEKGALKEAVNARFSPDVAALASVTDAVLRATLTKDIPGKDLERILCAASFWITGRCSIAERRVALPLVREFGAMDDTRRILKAFKNLSDEAKTIFLAKSVAGMERLTADILQNRSKSRTEDATMRAGEYVGRMLDDAGILGTLRGRAADAFENLAGACGFFMTMERGDRGHAVSVTKLRNLQRPSAYAQVYS